MSIFTFYLEQPSWISQLRRYWDTPITHWSAYCTSRYGFLSLPEYRCQATAIFFSSESNRHSPASQRPRLHPIVRNIHDTPGAVRFGTLP